MKAQYGVTRSDLERLLELPMLSVSAGSLLYDLEFDPLAVRKAADRMVRDIEWQRTIIRSLRVDDRPLEALRDLAHAHDLLSRLGNRADRVVSAQAAYGSSAMTRRAGALEVAWHRYMARCMIKGARRSIERAGDRTVLSLTRSNLIRRTPSD